MNKFLNFPTLVKSKLLSSRENSIRELEDGGERIEIDFNSNISFNKLDVYQKSHYRRYQFAKEHISSVDICGDFACGTGYGSVILASKAKKVTGVDLNQRVINEIQQRYKKTENVEFIRENLLDLSYKAVFDTIVSFETVEHLKEDDIPRLFEMFHAALKNNGRLIFSTPYMQESSEVAITMGFHLTFYIDEKKIESWLHNAGFTLEFYRYQNYQTHNITKELKTKDFIICFCKKR